MSSAAPPPLEPAAPPREREARAWAAVRAHPRKRRRPFASGALPVGAAYVAVPLLVAAGAALAAPLPAPFRLLLGAYLLVTAAYSFALKRWPIADVMVLASLYTARIFAGAFATGIPVSEWLASFSMFLFLSLRLWLRARRGEVDDDPVLFALKDPVTYAVGALGAGVLAVAA